MARSPRIRRVPVRLPDASARAGWLRSMRLSGFGIAMITVLVLTVVVLAPPIKVLVEQRQEIAALEAEVDGLRDEVDDLAGERARWDDPRYIEAQARERLNYVYPGEVRYLVIDDGRTVTTGDGQPISDELQRTQVDWARMLLESVLAAGLSDAPPEELPMITTIPSLQGAG